ncbi:MFS transporter [Streptomyces sp. NPDC058256]|uniref:MFS transporter n=1 Tax=Streptomyces sp. NPDC058256 TaxID=3346408 RepID=UPI0036EBF3FC
MTLPDTANPKLARAAAEDRSSQVIVKPLTPVVEALRELGADATIHGLDPTHRGGTEATRGGREHPSRATPRERVQAPHRRHELAVYEYDLALGGVGGAVTAVALPLVALITLNASPVELGILIASQRLPRLLTALVTGALVDRCRKMPLLIGGKIAGGVLLAAIPITESLHVLTVPVLCVIGGALSAVHDVTTTASASYLPSLVQGEGLTAANSRLGVMQSVTDAVGAYLASGLIAVLGASRAVLADAAAYAIGAALLTRIRTAEPARPPRPGRTLRQDITEGLRYTRRHPIIWPLLRSTAALSVAMAPWDVLLVFLLVHELHWSATAVAVILSCGSLGGAIGALMARRLGRPRGPRWGLGPLLVCVLAVHPLALFPILSAGPGLTWQIMVGAAFAMRCACMTAHGTTQRAVRQSACAPEFQGRQQAVHTLLVFSPAALSALGAGALAHWIGVRHTMLLSTLAAILPCLMLLHSPVRKLLTLPAVPDRAVHGAPRMSWERRGRAGCAAPR